MMHENFEGRFNCPVYFHRGCVPDSPYTQLKRSEKQVWSFTAWPFLWVVYSTHFWFVAGVEYRTQESGQATKISKLHL